MVLKTQISAPYKTTKWKVVFTTRCSLYNHKIEGDPDNSNKFVLQNKYVVPNKQGYY